MQVENHSKGFQMKEFNVLITVEVCFGPYDMYNQVISEKITLGMLDISTQLLVN